MMKFLNQVYSYHKNIEVNQSALVLIFKCFFRKNHSAGSYSAIIQYVCSCLQGFTLCSIQVN